MSNEILILPLTYTRFALMHVQSTSTDQSDADLIKIKERSFLEKVKEYNLTDLKPFLQSGIFAESGFAYDPEQAVITHSR